MWYNMGEEILIKSDRSAAANSLRPEYSLQGDYTMPHHTITYKPCTKCGERKPATTEFFHRLKGGAGGLNPCCKECKSEYDRRYREANRERERERKRRWARENPERDRERKQRHYAKNPEYFKRRYAENREQIQEYNRQWSARNPEYARARKQRRRAREQDAEGSHTAEDIVTQYERQKGRCFWCNEKLGDTYHIDHVVPLVRGGSNWPENIVIACSTCNLSRGAKLPSEWPEGGRLL